MTRSRRESAMEMTMSAHKASNAKVQIAKNGPYLVSRSLPLAWQTIGTNPAGETVKWIAGHVYPARATYAWCRCRHDRTRRGCGSTPTKVGFDGTETAS